jgi:hypothetical protein
MMEKQQVKLMPEIARAEYTKVEPNIRLHITVNVEMIKFAGK